MNNVININYGIRGEKRLILRDLMGNPVLDTGWSSNVITNTGLLGMVDNPNWGGSWCLGSSAAVASETDTQIGQLLKYMTQSTGVADVKTNSGNPNYVISHTSSKRWEAGTGGTVREFVLSSNTNGTGAGVRTNVIPEVVKGNDQILDFYYRMTATPDLIDKTGSITVVDAGSGNKNYNYIARLMNVDTTSLLWNIINGDWSESSNYAVHKVWSGNIGAVTAAPTGTSNLSDNLAPPERISATRSGDTATRVYRINIGVDSGNFVDGIRSLSSNFQIFTAEDGGMQVQFDDPLDTGKGIIKTTNDKITFDLSVSVTRT